MRRTSRKRLNGTRSRKKGTISVHHERHDAETGGPPFVLRFRFARVFFYFPTSNQGERKEIEDREREKKRGREREKERGREERKRMKKERGTCMRTLNGSRVL